MRGTVAELLPGEHFPEPEVRLAHLADGRTSPVGAVEAPTVIDRDHRGEPQPLLELPAAPDQFHIGPWPAEAMRANQGVGLSGIGDQSRLEGTGAVLPVVEGKGGGQTIGQRALARGNDRVAELEGLRDDGNRVEAEDEGTGDRHSGYGSESHDPSFR